LLRTESSLKLKKNPIYSLIAIASARKSNFSVALVDAHLQKEIKQKQK